MTVFPVRRLFTRLNPRETALIGVLAALALLAMFGPALPSELAATPHFVDQRTWNGLPNAMNVLSNLPFLMFGLWGLVRLHRLDHEHERAQAGFPQRHALAEPQAEALDCAWLFFAGLVVTAAGSAFYHLQPDVLRLSADRAGMAVAFAGLIGVAVSERVSPRAGWPAACFMLGGGLLAVAVFHETHNVLPWAVVQFGGMLLVLGLALLRPVAGALGLKLGWVIFFYALAKMLELADSAFYEATAHLVSGHSLKHLIAAMAALPVLRCIQTAAPRALRHNPGAAAASV